MTLRLPESLAAWGSPAFPVALKRELAANVAHLPLQAALAGCSAVSGEQIEVMAITSEANAERICAKVGVFFSGIVAGCNCADDPTPVEAQNEYCELEIVIDRQTTAADVRIV